MYQYILYRAKKDSTGIAAQFKVVEHCFLTLARQGKSDSDYDVFSWPKFGEAPDPKKNITLKLDLNDIGSILSVLNGSQDTIDLYHEFEKDGQKTATQIKVGYYAKEGKDKLGNAITYKGFSFNIIRKQEKYGFILSLSEAEVLKILFQEAVYKQCFVDESAFKKNQK